MLALLLEPLTAVERGVRDQPAIAVLGFDVLNVGATDTWLLAARVVLNQVIDRYDVDRLAHHITHPRQCRRTYSAHRPARMSQEPTAVSAARFTDPPPWLTFRPSTTTASAMSAAACGCKRGCAATS